MLVQRESIRGAVLKLKQIRFTNAEKLSVMEMHTVATAQLKWNSINMYFHGFNGSTRLCVKSL